MSDLTDKLLDEESIQRLISVLEAAKKAGYNSSSSPIEFLFEAAIDLLLLLSTQLKEGKLSSRTNPELIFLDWAKPDALGNSKSVRLYSSRKVYYDPASSAFLRKIAVLLVELKKQHSLPDALKSSELEAVCSLTRPAPQKKQRKNETFSYYRRQRRKSRSRR